MAAPMRLHSVKIISNVCRQISQRQYSSRLRRSIQNIHTPETDAENTRRPGRIVNPKKNPYLKYDPSDPVQRGQLYVSNNKQLFKQNKNKGKSNTSNQLSNESSRRIDSGNLWDDDVDSAVTSKQPGKRVESPRVEAKTDESPVQNHKRRDRISSKTAKPSLHFPYTWIESNDPKTGNLILRSRSKKFRHDTREIVIEGLAAVKSTMAMRAKLKSLYFSGADTVQLLDGENLENVELYKISYDTVKICTQTEMPDGVLGVFDMPDFAKVVSPIEETVPLTVVIDGIKEPRELGSLLHIASAVKCHKIITTKGCSDIWSMKALRTGNQAQFKVPIYDSIPWTKLESALSYSGDDVRVFAIHAGYGQENVLESLNGTTKAVEAIEKFRALELFEEDEENIEGVIEKESDSTDKNGNKNSRSLTQEEYVEGLETDTNYESGLEVYRNAPIVVRPCDSINFSGNLHACNHVVLVISHGKGELSLEARKLLYDSCGEYLTLPCDIGGLDLKVASGIVMYELAKQWNRKMSDEQ